MKKGKGKSKGGDFERCCAKDLSLWWTEGKDDRVFWRTHGSGMLGHLSAVVEEQGDLMSVKEIGRPFTEHMHVEIRTGRSVRWVDLVYGDVKTSGLRRFLNEGVEKAKKSKRVPFWMFREIGRKVLVILFGVWGEERLGDLKPLLIFWHDDCWYSLFDWEDFKKNVPPNVFAACWAGGQIMDLDDRFVGCEVEPRLIGAPVPVHDPETCTGATCAQPGHAIPPEGIG